METEFNGPVVTRVSKEAANAAYLVLFEFLSEGGRIPGISYDLVLEFTEALMVADQVIIED